MSEPGEEATTESGIELELTFETRLKRSGLLKREAEENLLQNPLQVKTVWKETIRRKTNKETTNETHDGVRNQQYVALTGIPTRRLARGQRNERTQCRNEETVSIKPSTEQGRGLTQQTTK